MTFLLDTNVISELRRPQKADRSVRDWAAAQKDDDLHCSSISILELEIGTLRLLRRDRRQGGALRAWLNDHVIPSFGNRVLALDIEIAIRCGALHVPDPRPDRDAWIAATALVHDLTVVTRNVRDFESTGVRLFNPWDA